MRNLKMLVHATGILEVGGTLAVDRLAQRVLGAKRRAIGGETTPTITDLVLIPDHMARDIGQHLADSLPRPARLVEIQFWRRLPGPLLSSLSKTESA
jgi:hypothetical protein